jgi:hypothetical protein
MRLIFLGWICFQSLDAEENPVLRFDDAVTWRQVFDSGFRPKHVEGLERNTCVCQNQIFSVQFKDRELKFKLEKGSIDFAFSYGDFLQMIWHQGAEAITLEEGEMRVAEFRKIFDGYIVQEMTMPRLIDPSGLVDANNNENNIKARVGQYRISYGFDNSFGTVKPIIPHFYITWSFPEMPDVKLKDFGDVVRPPKGYEWYSLDPKVNTPDPTAAVSSSSDSGTKELPQNASHYSKEARRRNLPESKKLAVQNTPWGWWVALFAVVTAVVIGFLKKLMKRLKR